LPQERYRFNLYPGITGQAHSLNRGPRWGLIGKKLSVNFIHGRELFHVGQEYRGLHDKLQIASRGGKHRCQIVHYLPGLFRNSAGNKFPRFRVNRNLARDKNKSACFDGLRVGSDSLRGLSSLYNLPHSFDRLKFESLSKGGILTKGLAKGKDGLNGGKTGVGLNLSFVL
jgi:hypothetical protein